MLTSRNPSLLSCAGGPEAAKAKSEAPAQTQGTAFKGVTTPQSETGSEEKTTKEQEAREGEYMVGEADNTFTLTTTYAGKAQAIRAAQAKWDKLQRGVAEFSITLAVGRPELYPETPVKVKGFKSVIDNQPWIITKVIHSLNNSGYTTNLELEVLLSDISYEAIDG